MLDAEKPMPAALASMPMPSFADVHCKTLPKEMSRTKLISEIPTNWFTNQFMALHKVFKTVCTELAHFPLVLI
jgi:hypothetical protein